MATAVSVTLQSFPGLSILHGNFSAMIATSCKTNGWMSVIASNLSRTSDGNRFEIVNWYIFKKSNDDATCSALTMQNIILIKFLVLILSDVFKLNSTNTELVFVPLTVHNRIHSSLFHQKFLFKFECLFLKIINN